MLSITEKYFVHYQLIEDMYFVKNDKKNMDNYNSVSNCCNIGYTPINVISTDKSQFIALLELQSIEQDMHTRNLLGYLEVGFRLFAEIISEYGPGMVLTEARLIHFN